MVLGESFGWIGEVPVEVRRLAEPVRHNQHVTLSLPATVASCLAATTREKTVLSLGKQKNGGGRVIRFRGSRTTEVQACHDMRQWVWIFRNGVSHLPQSQLH